MIPILSRLQAAAADISSFRLALAQAAGVICQRDPFLFDAVMLSFPATTPVRVNLGPGVFETEGFQSCYRVLNVTGSTPFTYQVSYSGSSLPALPTFVGAWLNRWTSDYVKVTALSGLGPVVPMSTRYAATVTTESPHFLIKCGPSCA